MVILTWPSQITQLLYKRVNFEETQRKSFDWRKVRDGIYRVVVIEVGVCGAGQADKLC